jgi:hypothetical protein
MHNKGEKLMPYHVLNALSNGDVGSKKPRFRAGVSSLHFRRPFAAILLSWSATLLCCNEAKSPREAIVGTWGRGTPFHIVILADGTYQYRNMRAGNFSGEWSIDQDMIRFVDDFCGTSLPGQYRFLVGKDTLRLEKIEDEYCARADFMRGRWVRRKDHPSSTVTTTAEAPDDSDSMMAEYKRAAIQMGDRSDGENHRGGPDSTVTK